MVGNVCWPGGGMPLTTMKLLLMLQKNSDINVKYWKTSWFSIVIQCWMRGEASSVKCYPG